MMYVFGVGEIPVSISGDASDPSRLVQTIRSVGAVSEAVTALKPGDLLGLRGPFGTAWPTEELAGQDVVVVAGGLGLAPLRPSIYHLLANRGQFGKVVLLYGTRSPEEILYRRQLEPGGGAWTCRSRSRWTTPAAIGAATWAWSLG